MAGLSPDISPVFSIENLGVRYGRTQAVDGLHLQLDKGEALGLLGANGAGKTSTLRALMGMQAPQQGKVRVFGMAPGKTTVLKRVGFAPEEAVPPERFTGAEFLEFVSSLRGVPSGQRRNLCAELLQDFDLVPHKQVRQYSKGMKRRLVLAQAFVANPELLILDEPLNGLDPLIIVNLRQRLEKYLEGGGSLLYSSHILAEVEKTCTRIVVLRDGRLVYSATTREAVQAHGSVEGAFEAFGGRRK